MLWHAVHQALPNRPSSKVERPDRSQTIVFLLEPYAPAAIKPRRDDAHPDARPGRADRTHDTVVSAPVYGSEISNSAALSSAPLLPLTTGDTAAMPSAEAASAPQPKQVGPPLNLTLSREALKSLAAPGLAARSPFQGRLPATVERAIAEVAAETGPWTEERIDFDHIRLRRGTTCVMLSRPEIAKIDPFSDSIGRISWDATASQCR